MTGGHTSLEKEGMVQRLKFALALSWKTRKETTGWV